MSSIRATLPLSVLAGTGMLSSAAFALPAADLAPTVLHQNVEQVRLVCDAFGRCVRTRPPVVRVLPGVAIGRPVYRGPVSGEPGISGRGGFGVDRRRDFEREGRGRMEGEHRDHGDQGMKRRREGDGGDRMQGDRGDRGGMGGQGQRRRLPQGGGEGGQRGGGDGGNQ